MSLYLFIWYQDEISFHASYFGMSSFQFSIGTKFSFWNDILILFWHHVNWKWTPSRDETTNCGGHSLILEQKNRDGLFCLAQRSSPMVTLLVKIADMAIKTQQHFPRNLRHLCFWRGARNPYTRLADWCFHVNAVRTSFWNETHSDIMWTAPRSKWGHYSFTVLLLVLNKLVQ